MALDPITAIIDTVGTVIDKIFPDANEAAKAKYELEKMRLTGELQQISDAVKLQLAQIEVNKEEAKDPSLWKSGWRPFVGWVGGFSLLYAAIVEPAWRFIAMSVYTYTGPFPVLDNTITMQVLFGLLGFGAYRSFEKVKGVSTK